MKLQDVYLTLLGLLFLGLLGACGGATSTTDEQEADEPAQEETAAVPGVGMKPIPGAEVLFDGSRDMLDEKWTYWEGPRLAASLPIKWEIVPDPVDEGTALDSNDPAAAGGVYGAADIVTQKKYRDFRLHVEFCGAT